ncbi:MAG: alkyl sulfatase dimerization domain-containing protein, partial [Desulfovibrionaceae bacterium]|nr:alkyl sulfatase dimerization domain-containing protein [Desulfovibrionaceae bacterium]
SSSLIPPTRIIEKNGQKLTLDGLDFIFLLTPDTEAPAEMHWYIPALKALTAAENCTHTMHNLYTLRGAKTRDPMRWARALDATLQLWGHEAEVLYGMHHWPVWGTERIHGILSQSRDLYRYIHDQTLRLANKGLTMQEIADSLRLPPELANNFALRGYYGSVSHNVRAVYNLYLGWFDGNPAHLNPLAPEAAAQQYVRYIGGAEAVIQRAREDFARGEYRWVAQVLDHVIFADPNNKAARELAADALEQLGYQAESGPWRNFYLSGARELRSLPSWQAKKARHSIAAQATTLPPAMFFEYLGIRLDAPKVTGQRLALDVEITDLKQRWRLELGNGVLQAWRMVDDVAQASAHGLDQQSTQLMALASSQAKPDVRLCAPWPVVSKVLSGQTPLQEAQKQGILNGDAAALGNLLAALENFTPDFPLALP